LILFKLFLIFIRLQPWTTACSVAASKRERWSSGVDGMTVAEFERRADEFLKLTHEKLKAVTYRFKPARRALIPKEGTSKMRKLGIPVVMDRVVGQSINLVFAEIFDPELTTDSNFGFRKGVIIDYYVKYSDIC